MIASYLPTFEGVFAKLQMENLARYTIGLMISPNPTVSAMNDLLNAQDDKALWMELLV